MIETALFTQEIPAKGAVDGHVHFTLSSLEEEDVLAAAFCASVSASVLFEKLQAQGSNIIFNLGEKGTIDVLARKENDGLSLQWQPKEVADNRMQQLQDRLQEKFAGAPATQSTPQKPAPKKAPVEEPEDEEYLVKQITRIP